MYALKYIPIPEQEGYYSSLNINEDVKSLLEKQRNQWCSTLSPSLNKFLVYCWRNIWMFDFAALGSFLSISRVWKLIFHNQVAGYLKDLGSTIPGFLSVLIAMGFFLLD